MQRQRIDAIDAAEVYAIVAGTLGRVMKSVYPATTGTT
jgi:hypothetical protein